MFTHALHSLSKCSGFWQAFTRAAVPNHLYLVPYKQLLWVGAIASCQRQSLRQET